MKPHTNAYIHDWLRKCGPASSGDYNRAHGLTGKAGAAIGQRMAGMFVDGSLTREGRGGCGHPYVYTVARDLLSRAECTARARAVKAINTAKRRASLPPKAPKPPRVVRTAPVRLDKPKPSRRIKDDAAFTPSALLLAPADKAALPTSEDFIRAGGVVERLPSFLDRRAA